MRAKAAAAVSLCVTTVTPAPRPWAMAGSDLLLGPIVTVELIEFADKPEVSVRGRGCGPS